MENEQITKLLGLMQEIIEKLDDIKSRLNSIDTYTSYIESNTEIESKLDKIIRIIEAQY